MGISFTKYDRGSIPPNFMMAPNIIPLLEEKIDYLESNQNEQNCIDNIYNDFVSVLKSEMNKFLNPKVVPIDGQRNSKRRRRKPWWTDDLSKLWNTMCQNERKWIKKTDMANKRNLKTVFIDSRKQFDRAVQRGKGNTGKKHNKNSYRHVTGNTGDFWKMIGKIGMGSERNKDIPLEIVQEDGTITSSLNKFLNKWQTNFEKLFTDNFLHGIELNDIDSKDTGSGEDTQFLNSGISIVEVAKAIKSLNKNKSARYDEIPAAVLQSDSCINFLHRLFCTCFESGKIPKSWSYGVITHVLKHSSSDSRDPLNYRGITVISAVYKVYCYILHECLTDWSERLDKISDCQNDFRKDRNTIGHLSTLTNIIECRKK